MCALKRRLSYSGVFPWINLYPLDSVISFPTGFANTNPLPSDLSDGKSYPSFGLVCLHFRCVCSTELIHCTTSFHLTEVLTFLNRCHRFSRANCNDLPCLRGTLNQFRNFFRKLNFLRLFLCIKHSILVRWCNGRQ